MTTRQEIQIAQDLVSKVNDVNDFMFSIENRLLNAEGKISDLKVSCLRSVDSVLGLCGQLNVVMDKVAKDFINRGLSVVKVSATDLSDDVDESLQICTDQRPNIDSVTTETELTVIGEAFELYQPKINIKIRPKDVLTHEQIHLNILNDLLDAISYELRGQSSCTGQLSMLSETDTKELIRGRIKTARVYLSKLPSSIDSNSMDAVVSYIDSNLEKESLGILADYIDANVPKLTLVRRFWGI